MALLRNPKWIDSNKAKRKMREGGGLNIGLWQAKKVKGKDGGVGGCSLDLTAWVLGCPASQVLLTYGEKLPNFRWSLHHDIAYYSNSGALETLPSVTGYLSHFTIFYSRHEQMHTQGKRSWPLRVRGAKEKALRTVWNEYIITHRGRFGWWAVSTVLLPLASCWSPYPGRPAAAYTLPSASTTVEMA